MKIPWFTVAVCLLLGGMVYSLCVNSTDTVTVQLVSNLLPRVVCLESDGWLGSGVFVGDDLILTVRHVAEDANNLYAVGADGVRYPVVSVTLCQDGNDLVLARVKTPVIEPGVRLGAAVVGETVTHIGYPLTEGPTVTRGIISRVNADVPQLGSVRMIQTDAYADHGSSGGPIFDEHGELLGVVVGVMEPGMTFCIGAEAIKKFFADSGVK